MYNAGSQKRLNVQAVLLKMGLNKNDILPVTEEDIKNRGVPKDCQHFADLYVEIKTKHENERRQRLEALVRERVMKECDRIQWRQEHSTSTMVQSRVCRGNRADQLEQLLGKEVLKYNVAQNKRLKVNYQTNRKAIELESRLRKKLELASTRQKEMSRTRCEFTKRINHRRDKTLEKKKQSILGRLMERDVFQKRHYPRESGKEGHELETTAGYAQIQPKEEHCQPPLNEIQNIIMRNISQQDFEENVRVNQKVQQFRVSCISEKRRQTNQKLKEIAISKLNQQREAELLKNRVRIEREKLNGKGGFLTIQRFETSPREYRVHKLGKLDSEHQAKSIQVSEEHPKTMVEVTGNSTALEFPFSGGIASSQTKAPPQLSDRNNRKSQQKLQIRRKRKYADTADWLGICHEDIEALMLAFKDKFMDAVIQSEGLSISRNNNQNLPHYERLLRQLNNEELKFAASAY